MSVYTQIADVTSALIPHLREMNQNSVPVNVGFYDACSFIIQKGAGALGTAEITVDACDDSIPSHSAKAPFKYRRNIGGSDLWGAINSCDSSQSFVTSQHVNDMYEIIVQPREIGITIVNGAQNNAYCRVHIESVNNQPVNYSIYAVLTGPRYPQDVPVIDGCDDGTTTTADPTTTTTLGPTTTSTSTVTPTSTSTSTTSTSTTTEEPT
jgi:hypothetical protein